MTTRPTATVLSEHPVAAEAAGDVLGSVVERCGVGPAFALIVASGAHGGFLDEITALARSLLRPGLLVGMQSTGLIADRHTTTGHSALAVLVCDDVHATCIRPDRDPAPLLAPGDLLLDLYAPGRQPASPQLVGDLSRGDLPVLGAASLGPVSVDALPTETGSALIALRAPSCRVVSAPAARPVGEPVVVTGADRHFVRELAGRPALTRLDELVESLDPQTRRLLGRQVLLGVAVRETNDPTGTDDFSVAPVIGADRVHRVLDVGRTIPVGATVQFHVADPEWSAGALRDILGTGPSSGALLVTARAAGAAVARGESRLGEVIIDATGANGVLGLVGADPLLRDDATVAPCPSTVGVAVWGAPDRPTGTQVGSE